MPTNHRQVGQANPNANLNPNLNPSPNLNPNPNHDPKTNINPNPNPNPTCLWLPYLSVMWLVGMELSLAAFHKSDHLILTHPLCHSCASSPSPHFPQQVFVLFSVWYVFDFRIIVLLSFTEVYSTLYYIKAT